MDYHDDFPPESSSFASVGEAKPSFFRMWFSGFGNIVGGLFIGAVLFAVWYLVVLRSNPFGPHFDFRYLTLFPAFWWFGMPFVLRYFYWWSMVTFRGMHWDSKPNPWGVFLCWAPLFVIALITPYGLIGFALLLLAAVVASRRSIKGV